VRLSISESNKRFAPGRFVVISISADAYGRARQRGRARWSGRRRPPLTVDLPAGRNVARRQSLNGRPLAAPALRPTPLSGRRLGRQAAPYSAAKLPAACWRSTTTRAARAWPSKARPL
jgi:hypothetical protein